MVDYCQRCSVLDAFLHSVGARRFAEVLQRMASSIPSSHDGTRKMSVE